MSNKITYRSLSVKLFDTWRILLYGFIFLSLILGIVLQDTRSTMFASIIIILIVVAIQIGISYSEVSLESNNIKLQNYKNVEHNQWTNSN